MNGLGGSNPHPPRLPAWLASIATPSDDREFVLGDLEEEFREALASGLSPRAAGRRYWRQAWRAAFGRRPRGDASVPTTARRPTTAGLLQDLRFAARTLRRAPGFTLVVLVTLGLGIGATTAIFSVVDAALLRPLPFADADRLVQVQNGPSLTDAVPMSFPDYAAMRASRPLEAVGAYFETDVTMTGGGDAVRISGVRISASLLALLGVRPVAGRLLSDADDARSADRVVLISESLWTARFGRDPSTLGRLIVLDDQSFAVVGVLPASFRAIRPRDGQGGRERDVWMPLRLTEAVAPRSLNFMTIIGRLADAQTDGQARSAIEAAIPASPQNPRRHVVVAPLRQAVSVESRDVLLILFGAVSCVLLITCTNLANLLLARASARAREMRVRFALGAARGRVARQLLTESLLLSAGGGLLGVATAWAGARALATSDVVARAGAYTLSVDWRLIAFAVALTVLAGVAIGLLPAIQAGRMREGLAGAASRGASSRSGARSVLIVFEIAITLVLLVGAGLLARSFVNLVLAPKGFDTRQVTTFDLSASDRRSPTPADQARFLGTGVDAVARLPGVSVVGFTNRLPLGDGGVDGTTPVEGQAYTPGTEPDAEKRIVSPDYFRAMGIPVIRGRAFSASDRAGATPVAIVNQAFVRRFMADGDPLSHRVGFNWDMDGWQQVVGVVGDLKEYGLGDPSMPTVYVSYLQRPIGSATFVIRSAIAPESLAPSIRQAIRAIDSGRPVSNLRTMDAVVSRSLATWRLAIDVSASFAVLALLLASTGIAGLVSFLTRQRAREFGIRLALGASRGGVLGLAMARALRLAVAGVALGVLGAALASRALEAQLYGVSSSDVPTFAGTSVLLTLVVLAASYVPARRWSRVDPAIVLRTD